jgi:hypothetical protein
LQDLPGAVYLYALATVSITFVGFAALIIVIRSAVGRKLTKYDTYFTLSFIQVGFISTAGALVPSLFALYGWSMHAVWRVSSAVTLLPMLWFVVHLPRRRREATGQSLPRFLIVLLGIQSLVVVTLLAQAAGAFDNHEAAVYATAIATILITSGIAYLIALNVILPEIADRD